MVFQAVGDTSVWKWWWNVIREITVFSRQISSATAASSKSKTSMQEISGSSIFPFQIDVFLSTEKSTTCVRFGREGRLVNRVQSEFRLQGVGPFILAQSFRAVRDARGASEKQIHSTFRSSWRRDNFRFHFPLYTRLSSLKVWLQSRFLAIELR